MTEKVKNYLQTTGIWNESFDTVSNILNNIVTESINLKPPKLQKSEINSLLMYQVPKLSTDDSCSLTNDLDKTPYSLAWTNPDPERLWRLHKIIMKLQAITKADWLGVYRKIPNPKGESVLVKESYYGRPSRAEFPLTPEFAQKSNNSTVGLTGKGVLVKDVASYKGPYYECDIEVISELCLPIFTKNQEVVGIIDAESFNLNFFTPGKTLQIAKVCMDLGNLNLFTPSPQFQFLK